MNRIYPEYSTKFVYLFLPLAAAFAIYDLFKKKKEDKINGTTQVKESVVRMLIFGGLLLVFFFLTNSQVPPFKQ